jgi:predicted nucleic-acid-binding Zn-ribbon protein
MKANQMCPKCRSRKLFVVKELGNEHAEYAKVVPMPVAVALLPTGGGLLGGSPKVVQAGHFEAWVCAKCGLTELYANKLAALEKLAETSSAVRVVEHPSEAEPEPYR